MLRSGQRDALCIGGVLSQARQSGDALAPSRLNQLGAHVKKAKPSLIERETALREELWPNSAKLIWTTKEDGYASIPRTITLIATLISVVTPRMDPSRVYLDLWARNRGAGIVEITNEVDFAACCGLASGTRAVRSWQERIVAIEHLGFIRIQRKGIRKFGFVLLLHPHDCVDKLRNDTSVTIPPWWGDLYFSRLREIRAPERGGGHISDDDMDLPF
jgi:hypothetical protein